jgi:hypothetical protein
LSKHTIRGLKRIEIATHCVPDLNTCVSAYLELLDYQLVDEGRVPELLAAAWATPAMADLPYALLQPASGDAVFLRFIETGNAGGYWPDVTQGWLSTELLSTDPDAVLEKLQGTAFTHMSGPAPLYESPKSARALQMAGPAGELIYFTRLLPGGSRFGLHCAKTFVDRPFIIMLGGTSMDEFNKFYGEALGQRLFEQPPFQIKQMSSVLKLPEATTYPITMAGLPGRSFMLELEELPAYIERRVVPEGQLPEGLAMISFTAAPLRELALNYRAAPQQIDLPPYNGRNVAVVEGPAGEWLELID